MEENFDGLKVMVIDDSKTIRRTAETLLQLDGIATISSGDETINLQKGEALLLTAGARVKITADNTAHLFRATVPQP